MKTSAALIIAAVAGTANAFVPPQTSPQSSTALYVSTKGRCSQVKRSIKTATKDNFSSVLTEIEPFLTNEAGRSIYTKSMRRIKNQAKFFKVDIPAGYAKEAKCTEKRREKQDAYCKAKAEENAPAEEEAAPAEE